MMVQVRFTIIKAMVFIALMLPVLIFKAPWFVFWPWLLAASVLARSLVPENAP